MASLRLELRENLVKKLADPVGTLKIPTDAKALVEDIKELDALMAELDAAKSDRRAALQSIMEAEGMVKFAHADMTVSLATEKETTFNVEKILTLLSPDLAAQIVKVLATKFDDLIKELTNQMSSPTVTETQRGKAAELMSGLILCRTSKDKDKRQLRIRPITKK